MYCGNCGSRNEDNAEYCGECGVHLNSPRKNPVEERKEEEEKRSVIGKIYRFKRNIFSYIYRWVNVEFGESALIVNYQSIPYDSIVGFYEEEKVNFGEVYWLIACLICAIVLFCAADTEPDLMFEGFIAIILGIASIPYLKNSVIHISVRSGMQHKIKMRARDKNKFYFLSDLEIMTKS
ncbi:MAG: zinc ribbon domain-containing protein [Porcipelethomonas sp.]